MRLLLQKVTSASVSVSSKVVGEISTGYLVFIGVMKGDDEKNAEKLAEKVANLRLFDGENGRVNERTLLDIGGEALVVSQFTLAGSLEKGNRPDYTAASGPESAEKLYEYFISRLRSLGIKRVEAGKFGAYMQVNLVNDGPVTLWFER